MGEAKRRKSLDPSYGKNPQKEKLIAEQWFDEMMQDLPKNYDPDYGHHRFKMFPQNNITHIISFTHYRYLPDRYGKMVIANLGGYCASILMTNEQFDQFRQKPVVKVTVWQEERYKAKSGEWVLPLKAITV